MKGHTYRRSGNPTKGLACEYKDYYSEAHSHEIPKNLDNGSFAPPLNQDIPDRFSVSHNGETYKSALLRAANNKARYFSNKYRDTDILVFDSKDPPEDRKARGRPEYVGRYRNGIFYVV